MNHFEKVDIQFLDKSIKYNPIYNWFIPEGQINSLSKDRSSLRHHFRCLICKRTFLERFGKNGNLRKHLRIHREGKIWIENYDVYFDKRIMPTKVDSKTLL